MPDIKVEDHIYVPNARLSDEKYPFALRKVKVLELSKRSILVDDPSSSDSPVWIGSSQVHKNARILILRIGDGDITNEMTLLNPISKSILQYLRLLVQDENALRIDLRTVSELKDIYRREASGYSHIVLIGHGNVKGELVFSAEESMTGAVLARELSQLSGEKKKFISLCCNTGFAKFARDFSSAPCCELLIAPAGTLHGADASQFMQTFLGYHFLRGYTAPVAFKNARSNVPGGAVLKLWVNGMTNKR